MLFPMLLTILSARPLAMADGPRPDAAAVLAQFPLRKGARWVFEGEAEWTTREPRKPAPKVRTGPVRDTMEVVQVLAAGDAFAAIVRGFPMDLAWYQPPLKPRISILLCRNGRLYQHTSRGLKPALAQARLLLADTRDPGPDDVPFLDLPLQPGKLWGTDLGRGDAMYRWVVEAKEARTFSAPGVARGASFPVFTATFRTNPDHLTLDFAPGVGLTGFTYEHHGTVARTRVHLVSFHP